MIGWKLAFKNVSERGWGLEQKVDFAYLGVPSALDLGAPKSEGLD